MATQLKKGILYIATGPGYISEAIASATSCKQHNKHPIALITDSASHALPAGLFDIVIVKQASFSYVDKLLMRHTPFDHTIFLDTDTYIVAELDDLFRILDFREFAIHQADEGYEYQMPDVSNAMPEFNTGVIAFKLTQPVNTLFDNWEASFSINTAIKTDQYHLRKVLYASDVTFAVFSSAYNFIIYYPNFVIQKVKVLHGRPFAELQKIAADINNIRHSDAWRRTYYPYNNNATIIYQNMQNRDIIKLTWFNIRALLSNYYRRIKGVFKPSKH
jgi:hypothetical protein